MLVQKSWNFDQEDAKWVERWNGSNTTNHNFSFFLIPFVGVWSLPYLPLFIFFHVLMHRIKHGFDYIRSVLINFMGIRKVLD